MAEQPLIPPYVTLLEYRGLIYEYLRRTPKTTGKVGPIAPIDPSNYEVIQVDPDSKDDHIYEQTDWIIGWRRSDSEWNAHHSKNNRVAPRVHHVFLISGRYW
jgi:hypothetical protein